MDAEPAAPADALDQRWQATAQEDDGFDATANAAAFFGAVAPAADGAAAAYGNATG